MEGPAPSPVLPCGAQEAFQLRLKARREVARRQLPNYVFTAVQELPKAGVQVLLALVELSTEHDPQKGWTGTGRSVLESELQSAVDCSFADLQAGLSALRGRGIVLPDKGASDTEDGYRLSGAATPESKAPDTEAYDEFPGELWRVPVPNEVFQLLPALTGSGVRAFLLMIRTGFYYDPDNGWVHGGRWKTVKELEHAAGGNPGATARALRDGLRELAKRGLVEIDRRGQTNHYWLRLEPSESSFTWLPTALLEQLGEHTTKALRVLLSIYRATWGWTDRREYSGKTVHKRAVQLSSAELQARTGLSANSVRRAVKELAGDWIERERPTAGAAYAYRPLTSNFDGAEKYEGGTSREKRKSNSNTPARGDSPPNRPDRTTEPRCSRGTAGAKENSQPDEQPAEDFVSGDFDLSRLSHGETELYKKLTASTGREHDHSAAVRKLELYRRLTSDPIGVYHSEAVKLLCRRSSELVEATIEQFYVQRDGVKNPGAWVTTALRNTWIARTEESSPDRSGRSGPDQPLGQIFADLAQGEGWEMSETADGPTGSTDRSAMDTPSESESNQATGMSRREAIAFLEDHGLLGPDRDVTHWFDVEKGDPARFYPNECLQEWSE